ncbi:MAG: O-antigen ligase family protein, partial [Planctomycetota bacterium]|nr:O-antigen ligase family protein [Planctomycetota bacterium]
SSYQTGEKETTFVGSRPLVWEVAAKASLEHPLLGWGQENFVRQDSRIKKRIKEKGGNVTPAVYDRAENQYLQIAYDCGIPAAVLYITLVILSVLTLLRHVAASSCSLLSDADPLPSICAGLAVGIFGYCIEQFFSFATINQAVPFWLLLGFSSALRKTNTRVSLDRGVCNSQNPSKQIV